LKRFRLVAPVAAVAVLALVTACAPSKAHRAESSPSPSASTVSPSTDAPSNDPANDAAFAKFYGQKPRWSGCGGSYECTKIDVPLDYAKPAGDTIKLALIRLPASNQSKRVGSLLINPGGPGASGIDYARSARTALTDKVRGAYDVIGFDPRGVGQSAAVECVDSKTLDEYFSVDASPDNGGEVQTYTDVTRKVDDGCEAHSAKLLPHVGTSDAARDMDVIRAVVGDPVLHYLGASYGTFLGATYAGLFPHRVGRLVLDGALDPAIGLQDLNRTQAQGFDVALRAFIDDCLARRGCPLNGSQASAYSQVKAFLDATDAKPLKTDDRSRPLTEQLAALGILLPLYENVNGWPLLRAALTSAFGGDGSQLLQLADFYTERQANGQYANNQNEANLAINCLDRPVEESTAQIAQDANAFTKDSPVWGAYLGWSGLSCALWPIRSSEKPAPITAPGAAPILVVGTTRDPATPYQWAVNLSQELQSGVLLTWNGDGHTAYTRGSQCIDSTVDAYLVDGTVPPKGKACT
jgi:pimeloyl-ACP methyl ester carboxylesterase